LDSSPISINFISPDSGLAAAVSRALGDGFLTRPTTDPQIETLQNWADVILLDLRFANREGHREAGLRLLDQVTANESHPPVVVLCESEERGFMLSAFEHGANDIVQNPPNIVELRLVLERAHRLHCAECELQKLRSNTRATGSLHELLGTSSPMQELFALARKIAPCDVNVLITGETGSGKELLARAIHHLSPRSDGPLVAFSCANLPETLVEDELFGHEKGAFTGALMSRRGRVEAADRGTLFLDEIGDLGMGLQPKLLRVIQQRNFERLGTNNTTAVDIRLICATNRNLTDMVQKGTFREELYYRLNVVQLHLPSLRERRDDIPLLAQQFLEKFAGQFRKKAARFSPQAMQALEAYNWPGNVRELENVTQRAAVLCEERVVELQHLPASLRECAAAVATDDHEEDSNGLTFPRSYEEEVRRFKRELVLRTLRERGWCKTESAKALGVARGYLHRLIRQLEIEEVKDETEVDDLGEETPPFGPVM
jgi:DNA-binding NtrC family response regulator